MQRLNKFQFHSHGACKRRPRCHNVQVVVSGSIDVRYAATDVFSARGAAFVTAPEPAAWKTLSM